MPNKASEIKTKLRSLGLSKDVIHAAWPAWWSEEAEGSPSAVNELRYSLSRKLGISPDSLFDEGNATFVWDGDARFKGLTAETDLERSALIAFGASVGRILSNSLASPARAFSANPSASELRSLILDSGAPGIRLLDLLALCWSIGIAVVQLRVFPLTTKKMAAMAIRCGNRYAILLGREAQYPASIAYFIAHELGHICKGHLPENSAIIDLSMPDQLHLRDEEEVAADRFGLSLLTGSPDPQITTSRAPRNSRELAHAVVNAGAREKIEPGVLALCYGHKTGNWKLANASLLHIYTTRKPVWKEVNRVAGTQLSLDMLTSDNLNFLSSVLGIKLDANRPR